MRSYCPFDSDNTSILANRIAQETAKKLGVSVVQLLVSGCAQREICPLPKSVKENRFISYLKIFELPESDFKAISALVSTELVMSISLFSKYI